MLDKNDLQQIKEIVKETVDVSLAPIKEDIANLTYKVDKIAGEMDQFRNDLARVETKVEMPQQAHTA